MRPAVIQLGGGPVQRHVIASLVDSGFVPIVVDRAEKPGGVVPGCVHVRASIASPSEILGALVKPSLGLHPVAVLTSTDLGVKSVPAVAASLGLPHATIQSVVAMDNKQRARDIMTAGGIPVPTGRVGSLHDERPHIDEHVEYVVKPASSSGSRGVLRACGTVDVERAISRALQFGDQYLVEEHVRGRHVDVNGTVVDGVFELVSVNERRFTDAPTCVPLSGAVSTIVEAELAERVCALMQRTVEAFGYSHGPVKADAIDSASGLVLLEVSARFHGDIVSSHAATASGRAPAALHWLARLGHCRLQPESVGQGAWFSVFADRAGTIENIEGVDAFRDSEVFAEWIPRLAAGDTVGAPEDNRALVGFGLIRLESPADVWAEAKRVRDSIRVSVR